MASGRARRMARQFILLIGILSLFADFTYEGSRSGIFWFLCSAMIGILYDLSLPAVIAFCTVTQFVASAKPLEGRHCAGR